MTERSDAAACRAHLVRALEADLVGPLSLEDGSVEELELAPSRWYVTGFLVPQSARDTLDPTNEEALGAGTDEEEEGPTRSEGDNETKQKPLFPASLGMSVFLPRSSKGKDTLAVTVSFAEYVREDRPTGEGKKTETVWRRVPQPARTVEIPLTEADVARGRTVPDAPGVRVRGKLETSAVGLPEGTRALSIFVVNERAPGEKGRQDEQFLFQVQMEIAHEGGFVPRPNRRGEGSADIDDETGDLQYRDRHEWAVGHGVAVEGPGDGPVTRLRTTWIPTCEVRTVVTHEEPGVETRMEALAELGPEDLVQSLTPMVTAYEAWIEAQASVPLDSAERRAHQQRLAYEARRVSARIRAGIELLVREEDARNAFQLMNRAMAMAARQRSPARYASGAAPGWRLFQLAFVLMSLPGLTDEGHRDREEVELIFFPTGGGKTEAYLGVIGFTLLLRRLRGQARPDGGLGVAVLLRYTLRLLTLDQLGRAATLICALEVLRREREQALGDVRFSVGLWVGRSATANTLEQVKKLIVDYKNSASKSASSPFPLTNCPWCGGVLGADSLTLYPKGAAPEEVIVACVGPPGEPPRTCAFTPRASRNEGIPVVFVDEQIYRELPCFLVATVDKFAMLPWRGETGMLFGRVSAREGKRAFGPLDRSPPKSALRLPEGFLPPELIVQDELHLISGPLGTMVGLYETAIEWLSTRRRDGAIIKPKIIASTATVRRAAEQVHALFGRSAMTVFPPPGIDASETFFATRDRTRPGRLYVGVAAPGRSLKAILLRTYVALLTAAEKRFDRRGPSDQPADAYMTVAGYFNSLRELGGMRRLVEDDVRIRAANAEERVPRNAVGGHPWARNRSIQMPVELTSREKAGAIKEAKDRLAQPCTSKQHADVLLASNMISVGVDIDRLGLMVIAGQPKTTSEYIQASSRVGRQHPGLVVTCFNVRRPRDRSHYERFVAYHESFYRFVEATSLTPFSGPALERGLAGTLVAMARLSDVGLTPPAGAMAIEEHRATADACVAELARRGGGHGPDTEDYERLTNKLREQGTKLMESWQRIVREARDEAASRRSYSRFDKEKGVGKPLLFTPLDDDKPPVHSDEGRFVAGTSMRDVEPSVHLWVERGSLGGKR